MSLYKQLLDCFVLGFGASHLGEFLDEGEKDLERNLVADDPGFPRTGGIDLRVITVATALLIAGIALVVTGRANRRRD